MDAQISLPLTLPVTNPTTSYWQDPPDAEVADFRSAEGVPEVADTVIIGSGITGVSVAWGLLDSGEKEKLVMLEARQAVSGATGRNGRFFFFFCFVFIYRSFFQHAMGRNVSSLFVLCGT